MGKTGYYVDVLTGKKQFGFVNFFSKGTKPSEVKTGERTVHCENNLFRIRKNPLLI